ncbi:MAG TPA: hypothetical protein P5155_01020 [Candidatus Absconditabacterales bacterium]|nr:hypothetical protein [Candidatus Absconditabacterales bacterium]
MKRKLFIIVFILTWFFFGYSLADMKDNFYCIISSNAITVTIEKGKNHKCSTYINVLSQAINKEYKDFLEIQKIIDQGYDVDFWTDVRNDKIERIKRILLVMDQIEEAVTNFNNNMFDKAKEYLVFSVSPYYTKYKRFLRSFKPFENSRTLSRNVKNTVAYMKEQVQVIENIMSATDYDVLIKNFNRYVYLKKQIEGK